MPKGRAHETGAHREIRHALGGRPLRRGTRRGRTRGRRGRVRRAGLPDQSGRHGFCKGTYRLKPPLPATPGAECVGRVTAVGGNVKHVKPGDLVINLQRENWTQKRKVKGDDAIPLPAGIDLRQAAMVRINPPTAQLMLSDFVDLKGGDWVIQNVANSAVGRLLIVLAISAACAR